MSARAILSPKVNSLQFDDRVLLLDVPAKIGRSHKDDQADSSNGFFDCKVLSRAQAMILFEDEKFFLIDTGSSNGSFVNNIRLSKAGEESKLTRIFTNDVLRFGSDVLDKSRQVTQKCIVCKIRLYRPNGTEVESRPSESRLFRPPSDITATDDLHALTQNLQDALTREQTLEDKLVRVRTMISKNIGRSHTDMLRAFENIKEELMAEVVGDAGNVEHAALEKAMNENISLIQKVADLGNVLNQSETDKTNMAQRQKEDAVELATLRKACQMQKTDISELESTIADLKAEADGERMSADDRLNAKIKEGEAALKSMEEDYEGKFTNMEEIFMDERTKIKAELHEVTSNEVNLLNRIKCLEADEGYSRTELDRFLSQERAMEETQGELKVRVEGLEAELQRAYATIDEQESKVVVQRAPEDIERIAELETSANKLNEELAYYKQELIDARARKSASDDELGTVRGKLETLDNTISSLSTEGTTLRNQISDLQSALEDRTKEATHLNQLVAKMEQSPSQDESLKVQIEDLRTELEKAGYVVKQRNEEISNLRRELRERDETIQQREIDISCLRGQVQNLEEEFEILKRNSAAALSAQNTLEVVSSRAEQAERELECAENERDRLTSELKKQQTLYSELKKMRGRGEELDALKDSQQEVSYLRSLSEDYEKRLKEQAMQIDVTLQAKQTSLSLSAGEAAQTTVGSLKVYELAIGAIFVAVLLNAFFSFFSIF